MSEGRDTDEDLLSDYWVTSWEQQTVQELESEADRQELLRAEADEANERMWALFQHAAQCVALMYKGGLELPSGGSRGCALGSRVPSRGLSLSGVALGSVPWAAAYKGGVLCGPSLGCEGEVLALPWLSGAKQGSLAPF